MYARLLLSLLTLGALVAIGTAASAMTYVVRPDGSGDFPTIQAAIDTTLDGDTILLTDGVFTGAGNRDLDYGGRAISIQSQSGDPHACVIDCEGSPTEHHRGVVFRSGEPAGAVLMGVTITNGNVEAPDPLYDGVGGGILLHAGSSPTIEQVVISNCTAMAGGGLFMIENAQPTITACLFEGNTAWWGSGGAISCLDFDGEVTDCTFRQNSGHQAGGAVACSGGAPLFERCTFADNTVDYYGAGFECFASSTPEVRHCTFVNNEAGGSGGGVYAWFDAELTLFGCTFYDNFAPHAGGIGAEGNAVLDVRNTIIAFGNAGEAIGCLQTVDVTLSCCDVYGNAGGDYVGCIADQAGVNGNKHADPMFCDAPNDDWTLHADSPCAPLNSLGCVLIGAWPVGCGTTGVSGASPSIPSFGVRVHPNPLRTDGLIEWNGTGGPVASVKLYDAAGRLLATRTPRGDLAGVRSLRWRDLVSAHTLPSGIYFIELTDDSGRQASTRIAVMR